MKEDSLQSVIPLSEVASILGLSYPAKYIAKYVAEIGCSTVVVERNYVDKDYLIDYTNYHARSFDDCERRVKRLHFFKGKFTKEDFMRALVKNAINETCGEYLGFSVVKPIKDESGQPIIGRTILQTYPIVGDDGKIRRCYIENDQDLSLFGLRVRMRSVPFQTQDGQVSKCATVALWVASQVLNSLFDTQAYHPSEITAKATSYVSVNRCFPSDGLILEQMLDYIKLLELEKDVIKILALDEETVRKNVRDAKTAVMAYVRSGLPVIATLVIIDRDGSEGYHAVVITGFGENDQGDLVELYIHDDQIGPYCRAVWQDDSPKIEYEWTDPNMADLFGCEAVILDKLIVPVYPKIRLPSAVIVPRYDWIRQRAELEGFTAKLLYTQVGDYKAFVIERECEDKENILITDLPRFLAVVRLLKNGSPLIDFVYDATANHSRSPLITVKYAALR